MIKANFGWSLRSNIETAQLNEVLLKILCYNYLRGESGDGAIGNRNVTPPFLSKKAGDYFCQEIKSTRFNSFLLPEPASLPADIGGLQ